MATPQLFKTPEKQGVISESPAYRKSSPIDTLSPDRKLLNGGRGQEDSGEKQMLKEISSRVKVRLRQSRKIGPHEHNTDIQILKKSNAEMQALIDQFQSKAIAFKPPSKVQQQQEQAEPKIHITPEPKQPSMNNSSKLDTDLLGSNHSLAAFKREVMQRVNAAMEANEEKMWKQQKYMSDLERRLSRLDQIEGKVDHLKFQRVVKMQNSPKKTKNYSLRATQVAGDRIDQFDPQFSPKASDDEGQKQKQTRHFFENPYKYRQKQNNPSDHRQLSRQYSELQQKYALLQQRYQIQVQNRIQQANEREVLSQKLQAIQSQNKNMRAEISALNERLKFAQEKCTDLQFFFHNPKSRLSGKIIHNVSPSLQGELSSILSELRMCGIDRSSTAEQQLNEILIERDRLKRENGELQAKIIEGCKFSCTHREVFYLKERIEELQKMGRKYRIQLEELGGGLEKREELGQKSDMFEGGSKRGHEWLRWLRMTHFGVKTAISRLDQLVRQCKKQGKI